MQPSPKLLSLYNFSFLQLALLAFSLLFTPCVLDQVAFVSSICCSHSRRCCSSSRFHCWSSSYRCYCSCSRSCRCSHSVDSNRYDKGTAVGQRRELVVLETRSATTPFNVVVHDYYCDFRWGLAVSDLDCICVCFIGSSTSCGLHAMVILWLA